MRIGTFEVLVIIIVALVVLGPDKFPIYAKKAGRGLAQLKRYTQSVFSDIEEEVVEPLNDLAKDVNPLQDIEKPLEDLKQTVQEATKPPKASATGKERQSA